MPDLKIPNFPGASPACRRRFACPGMTLAIIAVIVVMLVYASASAQVPSDLGFTTRVSQGLINQMTERFSAAARNLLGDWINAARTQKQPPSFLQKLEREKGSEAAVLQIVNDQLNRIPWKSDQSHWGQADYWATPAESVASNGADCEDYAIAKYYLLKELGVPLERLRITYVRAIKLNEAHMVLAYYASPDADPLILDNLEKRVRPASERTDLVPVYSFNDDEAVIVQSGVKGKPSQIRAWLSVQERLMAQTRI
jgi:predicted transglutaminase-like cysteine proteinase